MKINYKSLLLSLLGILFGFTIAFIIRGFWIDEFDWWQWLSWIMGGIIGHLIILLLLTLMNRKKDSK